MQILDTKGDCEGGRSVFVWGEGEGVSDTGRKAPASFAGVSESTDWGLW